jgi:hypothetical protein
MRATKAALAAAFLSAALLMAGCGQIGSRSGADPGTAGGGPAAPEAQAGNGIVEKSPEEIIAAAESALRSAESVRVKFDMDDAAGTMKGDLKLSESGDVSGWLEEEGLRINVILADGVVYFRSRELWEREIPEAAEFIGNRWVKVPPSDVEDMSAITKDLTIKGLAKKLFEELEPPTFVSKREETVGGQRVVRLKGGDGFLDVMATGEPYPVRLEGTAVDESEDGFVRFSDYGVDFKIKAPANPIDPSKPRA